MVVIGGGGLIGTKVVDQLRARGHEVVSASRTSGIDAIGDEGLSAALAGAEVVIDAAESPFVDGHEAHAFLIALTTNLLRAESIAAVRHHVAVSVVGVDRIGEGYFRAKAAQDYLVRSSQVPFSIVRTTQFFGLIEQFLDRAQGETIRVPAALIEPVAPDDVADLLVEIAEGPPLNGIVELAGPETLCLHELSRLILSAREDPRPVVVDTTARFFGASLNAFSLLPGPDRRIGPGTLRDWLRHFITAD